MFDFSSSALQNAESIDQIASTTLPLCRDTSSASSLEGGGGAGAALDTLEALQDIVVKLRARHVSVQDILNAVSESLNKVGDKKKYMLHVLVKMCLGLYPYH